MRKFLLIVIGIIIAVAFITCVLSSDFEEANPSDTTHNGVNNTNEPNLTKLEMIMDEGGVVAYSVRTDNYGQSNVLYIVVDCNTNTLYRFTQAGKEVFEESISGDVNGTFKAGSRRYQFNGSGIDSLHEEYIGHAKTNKSFTLKKRDKEDVYRIMNSFKETN